MSSQLVPNLIQGVSQQAPQQRRDTQCESQFDGLNSVSEGASARPHADLIKLWPDRDLSGAFLSEIVRNTENYLIGVKGNTPFAINLEDGTDCTVTKSEESWTGLNDDAYLTSSGGLDASDQFRAQVVEDTTFFINREIPPAMAAGISTPIPDPEAIVFVRAADYSGSYKVTITGLAPNTDDAVSFYQTPAASQSSFADDAKTDRIAERLVNGGTNYGGNPPVVGIDGQSNYSAERWGSTIRVWRVDGADFEMLTEDGNGDEFMYAFKGVISSFAKLPARAFDGFIVEVKGEDREKSDNFYLQFTGPPATGTWEEVAKPGILTTLDPAKMPHVLKNTGLNTFTYGPTPWSTRIAGDDNTAKVPSFVGKKLRDVFYHKDRLALLYNGGAVWSKQRFPFTYFPDTAQTVLATAPIDVKMTPGKGSLGASDMDFAIQVGSQLTVWSPRCQFTVGSGEQASFKQDTISADPSTSFEYARDCQPVTVGSTLYFASEAGPYAALRSVQYRGGQPSGDILVTQHVPRYIPSGLRWLTASDTMGLLFGTTLGDPTVLYCYNFLFSADEYLQSAWNTWRIPGGEIIWASVLDNKLRVLQQRAEGLALLKFNLTPKAVDDVEGATYMTRLDLRVDETDCGTITYDADTNTSSFTLPYSPAANGPPLRVIVREDKSDGHTRGRPFVLSGVEESGGDTIITVEGDLRGYKFYVGHTISAERTETRFYVRSDKGVLFTERLVVDAFTVEFDNTGYTRIEVSSPHKNTRSYVWEAREAGLPGISTGTPDPATDKLRAPVGELAENCTIRLINDSFLPSNWQAANYEYTMSKRP